MRKLCSLFFIFFYSTVYATDTGFIPEAQLIEGFDSTSYRYVSSPNQVLKTKIYVHSASGWHAHMIPSFMQPVKHIFENAGINLEIISVEQVDFTINSKTSTSRYFEFIFSSISETKFDYSDKVLNLFFTDLIPVDGYRDAQGLSDGIPGKSFCSPGCKTGVVITTPLSAGFSREYIVKKTVSVAHEIGHFLGLYHTKGSSEELGIAQTGFASSWNHSNHFIMDTRRNYNGNFTFPSFSAKQALIMSRHPLVNSKYE